MASKDWRASLDDSARRAELIRSHARWGELPELTRTLSAPVGGWGRASTASAVASFLRAFAQTLGAGATADELWALAEADARALRPRLILTVWRPLAELEPAFDARASIARFMAALRDQAEARWGEDWDIDLGAGRFGAAVAPARATPNLWPDAIPESVIREWDGMTRNLTGDPAAWRVKR